MNRPEDVSLRFWPVVLPLVVLLAGCGSDDGPITSRDSKYEVADGAKTDSVSGGGLAQSDPSQGGVQGRTPPPSMGRLGSPAASGGSPSTAAPQQPPSIPPSELDGPASDKPEDLLAYIDRLKAQPLPRASREQQIAVFQQTQDAIVATVDKILKANASDEVLVAAANEKVTALTQLAQLGVPGARDAVEGFYKSLKSHRLPQLAALATRFEFASKIDQYAEGALTAEQLFGEFEKLVDSESKDANLLFFARQVSEIFQGKGDTAQSVAALNLVAAKFEGVEDAQFKAGAGALVEQARLIDSGIVSVARGVVSNEPDASAAFIEKSRALLTAEGAADTTVNFYLQLAPGLESTNPKAADEIFALLEEVFANHASVDLAERVKRDVAQHRTRSALIGNPLTVDGVTFDGKPLDWSQYSGKVVLIDFWATWCRPCLDEMPNILQNYEKYRDQGFEVLGINIDSDPQSVSRFFQFQPLPWPSVVSFDAQSSGANHPMAVKCGVTTIPFMLLIGRDGNVAAMNLRGPALGAKLAELFGGAPAATDALGDEKTGALLPRPRHSVDDPSSFVGTSITTAFAGVSAVVNAMNEEETTDASDDNSNPYEPPSHYTPAQLMQFIFKMQEKPKSIQQRPGFAQAIATAADRILESSLSDSEHVIAARAKFDALHKAAVLGDSKADKALLDFAREREKDTRESISNEAKFFVLEGKALAAGELDLDAIPALLDELRLYYADRKLGERHLRIASNTVRVINRLEDEVEREALFDEFGKLFAASNDKQLARYGKKLAKSPAAPLTDIVGKQIELAGPTALGTEFDWSGYRGKVVIVEFWATWCAPCRRELPQLRILYEKHQESLAVVAVSLDQNLEALGEFLDENDIPWTNLVGEEARKIATRNGVRAIPTMLIVDSSGTVTGIGHNVKQIEQQLDELFAGK